MYYAEKNKVKALNLTKQLRKEPKLRETNEAEKKSSQSGKRTRLNKASSDNTQRNLPPLASKMNKEQLDHLRRLLPPAHPVQKRHRSRTCSTENIRTWRTRQRENLPHKRNYGDLGILWIIAIVLRSHGRSIRQPARQTDNA